MINKLNFFLLLIIFNCCSKNIKLQFDIPDNDLPNLVLWEMTISQGNYYKLLYGFKFNPQKITINDKFFKSKEDLLFTISIFHESGQDCVKYKFEAKILSNTKALIIEFRNQASKIHSIYD